MKFSKVMEVIDEMAWADFKNGGSTHYKADKSGIEPIDLYKSAGTLRDFALCSIIKYAHRNTHDEKPLNQRDLDKIIHYACLLKALGREK